MKARALQLAVVVLCMLTLAAPALAGKKRKGKVKPPPAAQAQPAEVKAEEAAAESAPEPTPAPAPAAPEPPPAAAAPAAATQVREIRATSGDTPPPTAEASVAPVASEAGAGEPLGVAVALKVGTTIPTSNLGVTYLFAGELSYRPPVLDRLLGVALELSFGQPSMSDTLADPAVVDAVGGEVDYELTERLLVLSVELFAAYELDALSIYGGAGYGFYFLRAKTEAFGDINTEAQVRGGLQVRAGVGYRLGPGDLLLEARWHYTDLKFLSTGRDTNGGGVSPSVGYRLGF